MSQFVQKLFYQLRSLYALPEVELQLSGGDFHLNMEKAIPLGLVLNELMTNSFKYAFADGGAQLRVDMQKFKDTVRIEVADDGPGLPKEFDPETTNRLGFKLIRNIVTMQLHGEYEVFTDNGTRVVLGFPLAP
jgi:two-component sensor histidine kinase